MIQMATIWDTPGGDPIMNQSAPLSLNRISMVTLIGRLLFFLGECWESVSETLHHHVPPPPRTTTTTYTMYFVSMLSYTSVLLMQSNHLITLLKNRRPGRTTANTGCRANVDLKLRRRPIIYPSTAKFINWNFHPLEVVSRWRDPQLQVSENYSDLTKWRSAVTRCCWLMSPFIFHMLVLNFLAKTLKNECYRDTFV